MAQTVRNPPAMQKTWVQFLDQEVPWRREWLPTPVILPREFHGQRSLVGYSPWSCKELDMTERHIFTTFYMAAINNGRSSDPLMDLGKPN